MTRTACRIPLLSTPLFTCLVGAACGDDDSGGTFGASLSSPTMATQSPTAPPGGTDEGGTTASLTTGMTQTDPSDPSNATSPSDPSGTNTNPSDATNTTLPPGTDSGPMSMADPSDSMSMSMPYETMGYGSTMMMPYETMGYETETMGYGTETMGYGTDTYGSGTYGSDTYGETGMGCYQQGEFCFYDEECCSMFCDMMGYCT